MPRPIVVPGAPPRIPRSTRPAHLVEPMRFSEEKPINHSPITLIQWARGVAPLMRDLERTRIDRGHGPARRPGSWALAFLAHVVGGFPTWKKWYLNVCENESLWRACGFERIPAYQTVWERFAELEQFLDIFEEAGARLIQIARNKDPRVGMYIVVDGTECQTHAQPKHDCKAHEACRTRSDNPKFRGVGIGEATELRQKASEIEETEFVPITDWDRTPGPDGLVAIPANGAREPAREGGVRFSSGGHWWRTHDEEAGLRSYGTKAWFGSIHVKATDAFTGAVIAVVVMPANVNEHKALEALYAKVVKAVGTDPVAFIADRGWATDHVYRFLAKRGVSAVIQYRRRHRNDPLQFEGNDIVDRHGIPRCKGCGLSGDIRKTSDGNNPRVWFTCPMPSTPACTKTQTIAMSRAPRQLIHTPRTSEIYAALRPLRQTFEETHKDWRDRYFCGTKNFETRIRRIGTRPQQMRSSMALIAEWLRMMGRQAWIGNGTPRGEVAEYPYESYFRRIVRKRHTERLLGGHSPVRGRTPRRVRSAKASP